MESWKEFLSNPSRFRNGFLSFRTSTVFQKNFFVKIEFHQFPTKLKFPTGYFRMKEFETLKEVFSRMFDIKERSV